MDNIYVASGSSAMMVAVLLQVLKRSALVPWVTKHSGRLNAGLGLLLAALSAAGVSYSFDFNHDTGDLVANVQFNIWTVLHWLEHTAAQWMAQQGIYWGAIKPGELLGDLLGVMKQVQDTQRRLLDAQRGLL